MQYPILPIFRPHAIFKSEKELLFKNLKKPAKGIEAREREVANDVR